MKHMKSLRKLPDRECPNCKRIFRPLRKTSHYCCKQCSWDNNGGSNRKPESWWMNSKGYIEGKIWLPDGKQRRVKQHRWIIECQIGRRLTPQEDIHHLNGIKSDNRVENLQLIHHSEHTTLSNKNRTHRKGYKLNLTNEQRKQRSDRAKLQKLNELGWAALGQT